MRVRLWTVLAAGLLAGTGTAGVATAGPTVVRVSPAASVESQPVDIRVQRLAPPAAVIPVEEIHAPLLLACGGVDAIWNSCAFASAIMHRLDAKPGSAAHVLYTYLDAGHPVGGLLPYEPGSLAYDANVPFDERACERLWPHVLAFLRGLPAS